MGNFLRSRARSFQYAFAGWQYVLRTQKNTWIHSVISLGVILMAFIFRLSSRDWVILIIAITIVWITELLNTALEVVIDLASPQMHPLAKIGKDVGAASVLLADLASIVIGLIILGPPFLSAVRELLRIAFLPNLEV